jgi:hypothetical protein
MLALVLVNGAERMAEAFELYANSQQNFPLTASKWWFIVVTFKLLSESVTGNHNLCLNGCSSDDRNFFGARLLRLAKGGVQA